MFRSLKRLSFVRLRDMPAFFRSIAVKRRAIGVYHQTEVDFARLAATKSFTTTWFVNKIPLWMRFVIEPTRADIRYLEIGAWEGMSALFVHTMKPQAKLTCIDTWAGSDEQRRNRPEAIDEIEQRFDANIGRVPGVTKLKGLSSVHLSALVAAGETFDVIYVDGSHHSTDVMVDCLLAWKLLADGGVLVGDDYLWSFSRYRRNELPYRAYRNFLDLVGGEYRLLSLGKQIFLHKQAIAGRDRG